MARYIGWRWAFLFQVPVCLFGIVVGYLFIPVPEADKLPTHDATEIAAVRNNKLKRLDIFGALTLVVGLATQLAALNLGGNIFPWSSPHVYGFIITSGIFLVLFAVIETRIAKEPIMPARMLKGRLAVANVVTNIFAGASSFSVIPPSSPEVRGELTSAVHFHYAAILSSSFARIIGNGRTSHDPSIIHVPHRRCSGWYE